MRFALLTIFREPLLRAVVTFLFASLVEATLRLLEERVPELLPLRADVRELRAEEEARELREPEEEDLLDELRFDPLDREAEARRFECAAVREGFLSPERERPVPPLFCLLLFDLLICTRAARVGRRWEDPPRFVCCAVSRLTSLLKLLFSPPAVVS